MRKEQTALPCCVHREWSSVWRFLSYGNHTTWGKWRTGSSDCNVTKITHSNQIQQCPTKAMHLNQNIIFQSKQHTSIRTVSFNKNTTSHSEQYLSIKTVHLNQNFMFQSKQYISIRTLHFNQNSNSWLQQCISIRIVCLNQKVHYKY